MSRILILIIGFSFSQISNAAQITVSGISSGGFMAAQMATIYSDRISGVATVAGGVFYCAQNHFQEKLTQYGSSSYLAFGVASKDFFTKRVEPLEINPIYQSVGVCMETPEKAHDGGNGPMNLEFMKEFESQGLIAPIKNISRQKVFIYQGKDDDVLRPGMAAKLKEFYERMGVAPLSLKVILRQGGHNFPTDREDGIRCDEEKVPYIANCKWDLAKEILQHTLGRKLERAKFNADHLHIVSQSEAPVSLHTYGYFYASEFCMKHPGACDLHVAFHGCKMSDDYDDNFQKMFESKINLSHILTVQDYELRARIPQMGAKIFAEKSGYAEYAESDKNRLMVYFPQTRITTENYPANPKGCWDWYGWTGAEYPTNKGSEASWLIKQLEIMKSNPKSLITEKKDSRILK